MKYFTLILLCFYFGIVHVSAQPVISNDALLTLGESETAQFLDVTVNNFNSGQKGINANWDFHELSMNQNSCIYEAMEIATSPYVDSFPEATVYFSCISASTDGELVENHTFYRQENNRQLFYGNVSISISDPDFDSIFLVYSDPMLIMEFPATYQDEFTDNYSARLTTFIGTNMTEVNQTGTVTSTIDGYGTIETKSGIFEQVIREKRIELSTVSIPGIPFTTTQETFRYNWLGQNENYLLMNLDSLVTKDFNGNPILTTFNGFYRDRGPSSVFQTQHSVLDIDVFPNPVLKTKHIYIGFSSEVNRILYATVISQDGSVLKSVTPHSVNIGLNKIKIDLNRLNPGQHYVAIKDSNGTLLGIKPIFIY